MPLQHEEDATCPRCKLKCLPCIKGERETAVACQNPTCRVVVDVAGSIIGRWSVGYKEYRQYKRHVVDKAGHSGD